MFDSIVREVVEETGVPATTLVSITLFSYKLVEISIWLNFLLNDKSHFGPNTFCVSIIFIKLLTINCYYSVVLFYEIIIHVNKHAANLQISVGHCFMYWALLEVYYCLLHRILK